MGSVRTPRSGGRGPHAPAGPDVTVRLPQG